jgi:predicted ester cyclase
MSVEENKALIRKFLQELYNDGNATIADEVVASPILRSSMKNAVSMAHGLLSNFQFQVEDLIAEDDKVVARCLMSGTFTRRLFGLTLSNRSIEMSYIGIYRIENNQIKGFWFLGDTIAMLRQLGVGGIFLFFIGMFGRRARK